MKDIVIIMNYLAIAYIVFTAGILTILSYGLLTMGKIISNTPDMHDRYLMRKTYTDTPRRHARLYVEGFAMIYLIGVTIFVIFDSIPGLVIGGVMIGFAVGAEMVVLLWVLEIYKLMKSNAREHKGIMKEYVPGVGGR
jgi:hypothetical protein